MGLIDQVFGTSRTVEALGNAAEGVSEVFVPNATRAMELSADIHAATLKAAETEFQHAGNHGFDRAINGLNRLPRPFLALGTLALFCFAMVDPVAFSARMIGLQEVPEPLWWLLGAIVSFYFGAREMHYARVAPRGRGLGARVGGLFARRRATAAEPSPSVPAARVTDDLAPDAGTIDADNPALNAWASQG